MIDLTVIDLNVYVWLSYQLSHQLWLSI